MGRPVLRQRLSDPDRRAKPVARWEVRGLPNRYRRTAISQTGPPERPACAGVPPTQNRDKHPRGRAAVEVERTIALRIHIQARLATDLFSHANRFHTRARRTA